MTRDMISVLIAVPVSFFIHRLLLEALLDDGSIGKVFDALGLVAKKAIVATLIPFSPNFLATLTPNVIGYFSWSNSSSSPGNAGGR